MGYYDNPTASDTREAMQALRDAGVTTVVIEFSGGNDEGGVDGITFADADGNEVTAIPKSNAREGQEFDPDTKKRVPTGWVVSTWTQGEKWTSETRPATDDEVKWAKVATVLEAPIYGRYYSFAGEFYVNGEVRWDVAAGTHEFSGQESHEVWEDID